MLMAVPDRFVEQYRPVGNSEAELLRERHASARADAARQTRGLLRRKARRSAPRQTDRERRRPLGSTLSATTVNFRQGCVTHNE